MDSRKPVSSETRARRAALVAAAAATAIWSGSALGRTQPDGDCIPADSLQGLNAPIESLQLEPVDHVPTEPAVPELADIDLESVTGDIGTPLLKLEPKVSEALREIFEAGQDDSAIPELATSPVADSDDVMNLSELNDDATPVDSEVEEDELSLLRRQMYRIDI